MAVVLIEKPERSGDTSATSGSGQWHYVARVTGEANPETALLAAIAADAGFFYYNLALKNISFKELGGGVYECTVDWTYEVPNGAAQDPTYSPGGTDGPGGTAPSGTPSGPASADTPLGSNFSLEIGGRPPKFTLSKEVVNSGAITIDPPDHGKLINYNRVTGEVEGVELPDPSHVFTLDIQMDKVTCGYIRLLSGAVWKVNDAEFFHQAAGNVAFMGCSMSPGDQGRVRCSYRFGIIDTRTVPDGELRNDIAIMPGVDEGFTVQGWEYLEVQYRDEKDAVSGYTVSRPWFFSVHKLLDDFDFAEFGIGT